MDPVSFLGFVAIAATVSAFQKGLESYKSWRRERNVKRLALVAQVRQYPGHSSGKKLDLIEQSLQRNAPEVEQEYRKYVIQLGNRFENGDDIFNDALKRAMETFSSATSAVLSASVESDCESLLEVSETARLDALNAMIQLCQRLQVSAPIRQMKTRNNRKPSKRTDISSFILQHQYQPRKYLHTPDNLREKLDQIPKVSLSVIISSDPQSTLCKMIGTCPQGMASQSLDTGLQLLDQTPYIQKDGIGSFFDLSIGTCTQDPPTSMSLKRRPAPSQYSTLSLASTPIYCQSPTRSLQANLNAMTQSHSRHSESSPLPSGLPLTLFGPPLLGVSGRIEQWIENIETESLAPESTALEEATIGRLRGVQ